MATGHEVFQLKLRSKTLRPNHVVAQMLYGKMSDYYLTKSAHFTMQVNTLHKLHPVSSKFLCHTDVHALSICYIPVALPFLNMKGNHGCLLAGCAL